MSTSVIRGPAANAGRGWKAARRGFCGGGWSGDGLGGWGIRRKRDVASAPPGMERRAIRLMELALAAEDTPVQERGAGAARLVAMIGVGAVAEAAGKIGFLHAFTSQGGRATCTGCFSSHRSKAPTAASSFGLSSEGIASGCAVWFQRIINANLCHATSARRVNVGQTSTCGSSATGVSSKTVALLACAFRPNRRVTNRSNFITPITELRRV